MVSASYLLSRRLTERRFNEIRLTDCSLYKVITDAYQMKSRRQTESISFALIIHLCWDKALHRTQQALSVCEEVLPTYSQFSKDGCCYLNSGFIDRLAESLEFKMKTMKTNDII